MNRKLKGLFIGLCLALSVSTAHANFLYEFSGVIPVAASITDLSVVGGETWTALVNVDDTVPDSQSGLSTSGLYTGAALDVSLSFSGGYSISFTGSASNEIRVWDNLTDAYTTFDGIGVYMHDGTNDLIIQVVNEMNLSSLTSDSLPLPGTVVNSDLTGYGYVMLSYSGALGSLVYSDLSADNTVFTAKATSVPEPATLTLMGIGLAGLGFARRK